MRPAEQRHGPVISERVAAYDERRERHVADLFAHLPEAIDRIDWPPERVRAARQTQLRDLLRHVKQRSPWHARRLAAIDAGRATELDLADIPPMTKDDLMANWDGIVTDRRLSLALCERHLEGLREPSYLLGRYHVVESGGSSGVRAVSVFSWGEWLRAHASYLRWVLRAREAAGASAGPAVVCTVAGSSLRHPGVAMARTFTTDLMRIHQLSVTSSLGEIVDALNRAQPFMVFGYASALHQLAGEAAAGRLRIRPRIVTSAVEPLYPEIREAIERAWRCIVLNAYGTSELGPHGVSCTRSSGIHIGDDLFIIEPVDPVGRPVAPGLRAAKCFITGLARYTLPLIRYEITDEIEVATDPCPCGSSFTRIVDVQGRSDECFHYEGGIVAHPHLFRTVLGHEPGIGQYQVRQTREGAEIAVVVRAKVDTENLARAIAGNLSRIGLGAPRVSIAVTTAIERTGRAVKLKRFVPLGR